MRRISEKRRQLLETAGPWREAFVREIDYCEWCQAHRRAYEVHEISQGTSRGLSLMERSCILCLCSGPGGCHDIVHRMPEARAVGLAILYLARSPDYSLSRFWEVTGRRHPSQREVDVWIRRLTMGREGR